MPKLTTALLEKTSSRQHHSFYTGLRHYCPAAQSASPLPACLQQSACLKSWSGFSFLVFILCSMYVWMMLMMMMEWWTLTKKIKYEWAQHYIKGGLWSSWKHRRQFAERYLVNGLVGVTWKTKKTFLGLMTPQKKQQKTSQKITTDLNSSLREFSTSEWE